METDVAIRLKTKVVEILLPYHLPYHPSYVVPDVCQGEVGSWVRVNLRGKVQIGLIWYKDVAYKGDRKKLKEVTELLPYPVLAKESIDFIQWVADYTMAPLGNVFKMMIPHVSFMDPIVPDPYYQWRVQEGLKETSARQKIKSQLEVAPHTIKSLITATGVNRAVINGLIKKGALVEVIPPQVVDSSPTPWDLPTLQPAQAAIVEQHQQVIKQGAFQVSVLDGVTGSGKTEVYVSIISMLLQHSSKQALILLPEIALTASLLTRFTERFGMEVEVWHSAVSQSRRRKTYQRIINGKARVIVGARSAIMLPYHNLGMIVVDESHDMSYKQEDGVCYHARDMAVVRGKFSSSLVLLASATPSVETMVNVKQGKYQYFALKERVGNATLPTVTLVDMQSHKMASGYFIAPPLAAALESRLEKQEQSLLFLNKRGYAPLTLCRSCGHRLACPCCTSWLVEHGHKGNPRLFCHHCAYSIVVPESCPKCHNTDTMVAVGPGVERLYDEVKELFPEARIVILTSDTVRDRANLSQMLATIHNGEVDIMIGTQLMAKGHHFADLTFVGVLDADAGLQGGDIRAMERSYQCLAQVSGRAGRENKKGEVYLQSYFPDSPHIQALVQQDRESFLAAEIDAREAGWLPPFCKMAGIIVSSAEEHLAKEVAYQLAATFPAQEDEVGDKRLELLGPAPAPLYLLRGKYRFRMLIRSGRAIHLQKALHYWLSSVTSPKTVSIKVDIDPYHFM